MLNPVKNGQYSEGFQRLFSSKNNEARRATHDDGRRTKSGHSSSP